MVGRANISGGVARPGICSLARISPESAEIRCKKAALRSYGKPFSLLFPTSGAPYFFSALDDDVSRLIVGRLNAHRCEGYFFLFLAMKSTKM